MLIQSDKKIEKAQKLDEIDYKIICQLLLGSDSKNISSSLNISLSTIQRRMRSILFAKILNKEFTLNCQILGITKVLLHVYLSDDKLRETATKISEMEGIISVALHVGNSDVLAEFVYVNADYLVDIISSIKKIESVERIVWSQEIENINIPKDKIMKTYEKLIEKL
jgi:DNA-binding Lrp family transcriptional regulator